LPFIYCLLFIAFYLLPFIYCLLLEGGYIDINVNVNINTDASFLLIIINIMNKFKEILNRALNIAPIKKCTLKFLINYFSIIVVIIKKTIVIIDGAFILDQLLEEVGLERIFLPFIRKIIKPFVLFVRRFYK
jgi:hypothetical protein